eukprot:7380794-Prymnesium_polylepis.1
MGVGLAERVTAVTLLAGVNGSGLAAGAEDAKNDDDRLLHKTVRWQLLRCFPLMWMACPRLPQSSQVTSCS